MTTGEFWDVDGDYVLRHDARAQPRDFSERNKAFKKRQSERSELGETVESRRSKRPRLGKIIPREYFFLQKDANGKTGFTRGYCPVGSRLQYAYGKGLETRQIAKDLLFPLNENISQSAQDILYQPRINPVYAQSINQLGGQPSKV